MRHWWLQAPYKEETSYQAFWLRLLRDLYSPIRLRLRRTAVNLFEEGPLVIPANLLTNYQRAALAQLCRLKCFQKRSCSVIQPEVQISQFLFDSHLQDIVPQTAVLERFVYQLLAHSVYHLRPWPRLLHIFTAYSSRYSAAACLKLRLAAMDEILQMLLLAWGSPVHAGVAESLHIGLNAEMPTWTQVSLLRDVIEGMNVVHINAKKQGWFRRELMSTLKLLNAPLKQREPVKATMNNQVFVIIREDSQALVVPASASVPAQKKQKISHGDEKKNEPKTVKTFTVFHVSKCDFMFALMRICWSTWLSEKVDSWQSVPPFARQFVMCLPRAFSKGLTHLKVLDRRAWMHRLCLPYLDPCLLAEPKGQTFNRMSSCDHLTNKPGWLLAVFLCTRYVITWHPEADRLPFESWLSIMTAMVQGRTIESLYPEFSFGMTWREMLPLLKDLKAVSTGLRLIWCKRRTECRKHLPALLDIEVYSRRCQAAYRDHDPQLAPILSRVTSYLPRSPEEPAIGMSVRYEMWTLDRLEVVLAKQLRAHEMSMMRSIWTDETHIVIRLPPNQVSLLDLQYTISNRYARSEWPEQSWFPYRLADRSVAAVVPRNAFRNACAYNYLMQRISTYSYNLEPAAANARVQRLPVFPFVIQAFFAECPRVMHASLLAMYSWTHCVSRRTVAVDFASTFPIIDPQHPCFSFYYNLPVILRNLCYERDSKDLENLYRNSFQEGNCFFLSDTGKFHALQADAPSFLVGFSALLALKADHYITPKDACDILALLEQCSTFQEAIENNSQLEVVAREILRAAYNESTRPLVRKHVVRTDDSGEPVVVDSEDMDPRPERKHGVDGFSSPIKIAWPDNVSKEAKKDVALPYVAVYKLLTLAYLPYTIHRKLLFKIGVHPDVRQDKVQHGMSAHIDVARSIWQSEQMHQVVRSRSIEPEPRAPSTVRPPADRTVPLFRQSMKHWEWGFMIELTRILEYGLGMVQTLNRADFVPTVEHADERVWNFSMDKVLYTGGDPTRDHMPSALVNGIPMWRDEYMVVFRSPWSSRHTVTTQPRPMYSATDTLLEYLLIQGHLMAPNAPPRANDGDGDIIPDFEEVMSVDPDYDVEVSELKITARELWHPRPPPNSAFKTSVGCEAALKVCFPIDIVDDFAKPSSSSSSSSAASPATNSSNMSLVPLSSAPQQSRQFVSVASSPSASPSSKRPKTVASSWRFSPLSSVSSVSGSSSSSSSSASH